jgi:hypothetical protein
MLKSILVKTNGNQYAWDYSLLIQLTKSGEKHCKNES